MNRTTKTNFVFFGTDEFAVAVLGELLAAGLRPDLVVTTPDEPAGRGRQLRPPPVKIWTKKNKISCLQPKNLRPDLGASLRSGPDHGYRLFLVASYGKILPPEILALPRRGALNIHPSLLPKFRGPTPIQSAILTSEETTGVTIILMDDQIDHGPILKAESYKLQAKSYLEARDDLAQLGARLLIEILPDWLAGKISPREQNHAAATETKKIQKADGLIDLTDEAKLNYRKFLALTPRPGLYCFINNHRVIITDAKLVGGEFVVNRLKPAGGREMTWADFQRGYRRLRQS